MLGVLVRPPMNSETRIWVNVGNLEVIPGNICRKWRSETENDIKSVKSVLTTQLLFGLLASFLQGHPGRQNCSNWQAKALGCLSTHSPSIMVWGLNSGVLAYLVYVPSVLPQAEKGPSARELQVSSELPEFWMNVRGHELGSDSFHSSFFCSTSHQPMRDPLSLRSPRDLMPPRLSVTPLVLFTYLSLAPGTVVGTQ